MGRESCQTKTDTGGVRDTERLCNAEANEPEDGARGIGEDELTALFKDI